MSHDNGSEIMEEIILRRSAPKPRLVALIIACAWFLQQIDSTITMTSLPSMAKALHSSAEEVGIALSVYLLSLAIFMPVSGWLADRFGAKIVFQSAILLFVLSSVFCGLSQNITEITIARFLQGCGGAMMFPVGRLLILRMVEKSEFLGTMAWLQAPAQLGPVIGLPLGGFITTYFAWRWNFFLNVPVGLIGIVMVAIYIPEQPVEERRPLDWIGIFLWGSTLAILLYGLHLIGRSSIVNGGITLAVASIAGLVSIVHSLRHPYPLIDLSLFRIPTFAVNMHAGSLVRYSIDAVPFLLPLLFQLGFGMTALDSGMLSVSGAVGSLLIRPVSKSILNKFGFRSVLIVNGILTAVSIAAYGLYTATTPVVMIFVTLAIGGTIRSLQMVALSTIAYADVPSDRMSSATSLAGMIQQLSNAIAIAIAVIVLQAVVTARGVAVSTHVEFSLALAIMACFSLLAIPLFFALPRTAGHEFSGHLLKLTRAENTRE